MNPVIYDYYLSSARILAKPGIEQANSCSQVSNATDWAMGLGKHLLKQSYMPFRENIKALNYFHE